MYSVLNLKGRYLQLEMRKILKVMLLSITALLTCMSVSLCKLVSNVRGGEGLIKIISNWNTLIVNQLDKDLQSILDLIDAIKHIRPMIKWVISRICKLLHVKNKISCITNSLLMIIPKVTLILFSIYKLSYLENKDKHFPLISLDLNKMKTFASKLCGNTSGITIIKEQVNVGIHMIIVLMITKGVHQILFKNFFIYEGILMTLSSLCLLSVVLKMLTSQQEKELSKDSLAFRFRCINGLTKVLRQTINLSWIKIRPSQVFQPIIVKSRENQPSIFSSLWELNIDIKSFFDEILHKKLMNVLTKYIDDGTTLDMIWKWLKAGYMEDKTRKDTHSGTPSRETSQKELNFMFAHDFDYNIVHNIRIYKI